MSVNMSEAAPAANADRSASVPTKPPRETLWRFEIEGSPCPQLLPRVLGVIARHDLVPVTIHYQAGARDVRLVISVEAGGDRMAALIATAMRRVMNVREVTVHDHEGPMGQSEFSTM